MKRLVIASGVVLMGSAGALAAECAGGPTVSGNTASYIGPIVSAVDGDPTANCTTTNVPVTVPAGMYGVYSVDSRGAYTLAEGDSSSYSVTAFGETQTTTQDGENFDPIFVRNKFATGLVGSDTNFDGSFDLTVTDGNGTPGESQVDIDTLDILVGYTTLASQQDSLDEVGQQQLGLLTHLDANAGLLRGSDQPLEGDDELGLVGSFGSFMFGATGRYNLADGFSVLGGASVVNLGVPDASAMGVLSTAALRYVDPNSTGVRFFGEGGVELGGLNMTFTRHYDNGTVADYEATGTGMGLLGAGYVRAGLVVEPDDNNEIVFSASAKQSILGLTSFVEDDPEGNPNLFSADYSGQASTLTTLKAGVDWTTALAADVDLTASGAIGAAFGSGASAAIFGIPGTVSGGPQSTMFVEYGLRLGWTPTPDTTIDGFVHGTTGTNIGTHAQVGMAYRKLL